MYAYQQSTVSNGLNAHPFNGFFTGFTLGFTVHQQEVGVFLSQLVELKSG